MIHSHIIRNNYIELSIYTCIVIYLITIIRKQIFTKRSTNYEDNKHTIYHLITNNTNLYSAFQQIFLNKQEILEMLMYDKLNTNIITGSPNKSYNIKTNFDNIKSILQINQQTSL